jgi:hypothetical protein
VRWLLLASLLSGCAKCGSGAADAGVAVVDAGARVRRSTDLRNALIQGYPEYRDTALLDSEVTVTRVIPGLTVASRDEALAKLRWSVSDAGSGWDLNKFHLEQTGPETLQMKLRLSVEDVGHLYLAPAGLSSMEMAMYLPRQLPIGRETFELDVHYSSSAERCVIRVRQAVTLLVANGQWRVTKTPPEWSPDAAGDEQLPEEFSVEVTGTDGARIRFDRARGQVRMNYALVTVE